MKSFKHSLIVHYSDTVNTIDINAEILINRSQRVNEIEDNRRDLIEIVKSIENKNIRELEMKNESRISRFCFYIPNHDLIGNLIILNRHLSNRSIQRISCSSPNKQSIYEITLFELIKNRKNELVIDLSIPKSNFINNLDIDGHNMIKIFCSSTLNEIRNLMNLENFSSLNLKNVLIQSENFFLCNFSGLKSLTIQSCNIDYSLKVQNLNNLVNADISFNKIRTISFNNLINLKFLNLKGNLIESIDDQMFQGLHRLEELDLKCNKIQVVNAHSLDDLENLLKLDLSQNGMLKFDYDFKRFKRLRYLNLGRNLFDYIELDGLTSLEYLSLGVVKSLKLNSLNNLKFLELDCDHVPDMSKLICLNFLVIKNAKYFNLDKNLKNLKFLILKFDQDPFQNEAIDLNSINQLKQKISIKIESPCISSKFDIDNYLNRTFKDDDKIEIDTVEFDQHRNIFINMLSIQEVNRFLHEIKISISKTSYDSIANFILIFKIY